MKSTEDKDLALKGMRRAAIIARERAARFGVQIPVWRNGAIVFIHPKPEAPSKDLLNADNPHR
jgi:hypothetical protein